MVGASGSVCAKLSSDDEELDELDELDELMN